MVDQVVGMPAVGEEVTVPRGECGGRGGGEPSVADSVIDLLRTVRRSKARLLAAAGDDVDSALQMLLRTAAVEGPARASALAVSVQSDLSTVSRHVAVLVTRGLLERRADPVDGRANLLVVTDAGRAVIAEHERARSAFFEEVLDGWAPEERSQFAQLLARFTAAYDTTHTHWTTGRERYSVRVAGSAEGSTV
ncbi:MarR family winged helix-turn-helix transcriptional regulator [Actinacidiphila yeochonensis]|uniref:MarR family winged helix-turn-helix transcriptional regulator n=1 Tax=Actinacidiphila yeochonensis TaxID=89050 RepID=UPI000689C8FC|nr:MarR family transcriptional regulator [Actinacidiphila yeochonensis]